MNSVRTAGALLIAGSVIFVIGAQLGVPRVFMEREPDRRLRMLQENLRRWRAAQPLYALGPLVTVVAVGVLADEAPVADGTRVILWITAAALLAGSVAWTRSVYVRAIRISDFAFGTLPGWPFATYVMLTTAGLAALGIGLLAGGIAWLGAVTLAADVLFLIAYARFRDIPPFVFYVLLLVVGVALVAAPDALG